MDDDQLVAAALAGDRNAFGAIYDRYADRIHDFCASILRNRAEASAALQETFLVAFEVLAGLAEPARLQPWLFAVAHRVVLERLADRGDTDDRAGDPTWGTGLREERLSRAELAEFVWQVAASLDERDRTLLDLHLRQGLEGRDLAGASGEPPSQVEGRSERLETQVERSLGALIVARTGRRSCPGLSAMLDGWDGELTPEFRDAVTAHVDDCERCNSRRRIAPSPISLLSATPLAPAPTYLRSVVLGKAELNALEREGDFSSGRLLTSAGWTFNRDGFPDLNGNGAAAGEPTQRIADPAGRFPLGTASRPSEWSAGPVYASTRPTASWSPTGGVGGLGAVRTGGSVGSRPPGMAYPPVGPPKLPEPAGDDHDWRGMLVGGLAGLIILIAGTLIVLSSRSGGGNSGTLSATATTGVATSSTETSVTTANTTAVALVPPSTVVATTVASSGHLVVGGSKSLNLGISGTTASVTIGNDGQAPLNYVVTATGVGLTVTPIQGTLAPGGNQVLTLTLDRTASSPGPFTGAVQISGGPVSSTINVTALIDPGPSIIGEVATHDTIYSAKCKIPPPGAPTSTTVMATVTATQPLNVVVLHWQSPIPGGTGTATMTALGSGYMGTLGPYTQGGSVDWWISAIDMSGVSSNSSHHTLTVC
jgi:RNA polymerase sigma factor (sigma-70 family)